MPLKGDLQRRSAHADLERGQGLLPEAQPDEGRPRSVLPRRREPRVDARAASPLPHGALPERGRRRFLPPEARSGEAPAIRRRALRPVSERAYDGLRGLDNRSALEWVVNLGCIDLHTWHSRVPEIEKPDYLLIDLDPTTDGQWPYVREIAVVVKEVMDELDLAAFPKTSGATGLHVLAPIKAELEFPEVRRFAKAIAAGGRAADRRPGSRDDDLAGQGPARRLRRLRTELSRPDDRFRLLDSTDS